ncbi:MAG: type 3 dihydrofolate reductase [Gammaproteobacteria bacterium]|nr:type 3 dihydrofolate reductase [Gammaproteobacteria bacterium]
MKISIIVAMAANRVIGHENRLPWHLPADLQHFKQITMGKPILMGRKTYESIGRPLPGRTNIVITRDESYTAEGCMVVHSMEEAMQAAGDSDEVMVIGGAEFYQQVLPQADVLYLTLVEGEFEGDAFFPEINEDEWREVERSDFGSDEKNPHAYSFVRMDRVRS